MQGQKEFFKGTSRKSRARKALSADYARIDERTLPEMLQYAIALAKKIPFFNPEGKDVHWDQFFEKNDLVQLIEVSSFQLEKLEQDINNQIEKLYAVNDDETQRQTLRQLSYVILLMAQAINNLKRNLSYNEFTEDLIYDISNSINGELRNLVKELYAYQNVLKWENTDTETLAKEIDISWGINSRSIEKHHTIDDSTIDRFKDIFQQFFYDIRNLMKRSARVLDRFLNGLQNAEPHIAMFLVFFKMFRYLQDLQNELTQRHLDFYYKDVLQIAHRAPVADCVNVSFVLKPGIHEFFLPRGTRLLAGKDDQGNKIIYTTNHDLNLAPTRITRVATIFLSRDPEYGRSMKHFNYTAIYSRRASIPMDAGVWPAFGEDQHNRTPENKTLDWTRLGFIIAAPILNMAGGERTIELILNCDTQSFIQFWNLLVDAGKHEPEGVYRHSYKIVSTAFSIGISTADGILTVSRYSCTLSRKLHAVKIAFTLAVDQPAIKPLAADKRPQNFPDIKTPFLQVLLNEHCSIYMYSLLQRIKVEDIVVRVKVSQSKALKLYNNYGEVIPDNPTQIFGPIPETDSYLLVGHHEAIRKNLTTFGITLNWYRLPVQVTGMSKYFEDYNRRVSTADYKLQTAWLKNFTWTPPDPQQPVVNLFEEVPVDRQETAGVIEKQTNIPLDLQTLAFQKEEITDDYGYTAHTRSGFFKLTLKCPDLAFGHAVYAQNLSDTIIANAKLKKGELPRKLPNVPFAPVISGAECYYTAETMASKHPKEIEFYQLAPFGFESMDIKTGEQPLHLLTQLEGRGIFHIGFDHYPASGELSLLFRMNETFYEEVKGEIPNVRWYYLSNNRWAPFRDEEIVQDTTQGFLHDGIIRMKIPKAISKGSSIMDADVFWIKAQIDRAAIIRGHLTGIYENSVDATWNGESTDAHLATPLLATTLSKLEKPIPEIVAVLQPANSFYGRVAETKHHWMLRTSERLRHKNRALTIKDFEELILEKFDIVFKVQCFSAHVDINEGKVIPAPNLPPGKVHIVVVPDVTNEQIKDKLYPRLRGFRLMEIRDYLKDIASPFIAIEVTNPFYEPICVHADVKFDGKKPDGYYLDLLNTEITQFLSAWLSAETTEEEFGVSIYKSDVLGFVQNRPYVQFVTEFSLVRINYLDGRHEMYDSVHEQEGEEEIRPTFPWSVITSARQHDLMAISDISYQPPAARSIGNMRLESDFLLD